MSDEKIEEFGRKYGKLNISFNFSSNENLSPDGDAIRCLYSPPSLERNSNLCIFKNESLNILFLGHVLRFGNPNFLLFVNLVELYKNKESKEISQRRAQAYEIFSIFIHDDSPLHLSICVEEKRSILDLFSEETNDEVLRTVFDKTENYFWPEIIGQLNEFLENYNPHFFGYLHEDDQKVVDSEEDFMLGIGNYIDELMKKHICTSEERKSQNIDRAVLMCIEAILSQFPTIKNYYNINFDFLRSMGEQKSKINSVLRHKRMSNHFWTPVRLTKSTVCAFCSELIWGTGPQGCICIDCKFVVHHSCQEYFNDLWMCKEFASDFQKRVSHRTTLVGRSNFRNASRVSDSYESFDYQPSTCGSKKKNRSEHNVLDAFGNKVPLIQVDSDLEYSIDVYDSVDTETTKMNKILKELIHTERTHLRALKVLHNIFYVPLKKIEYDKLFVKKLFIFLPDLLEYHVNVVRRLKGMKDGLLLSEVYSAFALLFGDRNIGDFKEVCAHFSCDYSYNLKILKERMANDYQFRHFIFGLEKHHLCRKIELKAMFSAEFIRLTKYPVFFEKILKFVEKETADYSQWSTLNANSMECVNFANSRVAETENRRFLRTLQITYGFKEDDPTIPNIYRNMDSSFLKLLFHGSLTWKISKRNVDCYGLVFEDDLILLTKLDHSKFILRSYNDKTQIHNRHVSPVIELNNNTLVKDLVIENTCLALILKKKFQLIKLMVKDDLTKNIWIEKLSNIINNKTKEKSVFNVIDGPSDQQDGAFLGRNQSLLEPAKCLEDLAGKLKYLMEITDLKEIKLIDLIENLNRFIETTNDRDNYATDGSLVISQNSLQYLRKMINPLRQMVFQSMDNYDLNKIEILTKYETNVQMLEKWSSPNLVLSDRPQLSRSSLSASNELDMVGKTRNFESTKAKSYSVELFEGEKKNKKKNYLSRLRKNM